MISKQERYRGALLGLAVGDALGTAVEFKPRGTFAPVTGMEGGGPFNLAPGAWTDDTSMALCLAASLLECRGFDASDQMQRYCRWQDEGYMSSTGECFDIGITVYAALQGYRMTGNPFSGITHERSAGNGCLMRLAPVPMFYQRERPLAIEMSGESSRTTHGAQECIDASRLFGAMLFDALQGASREDILHSHGFDDFASEKLAAIARGTYRTKAAHEIRSSGYVVDSLEAALWCFHGTDTFAAAVLQAANLGHDADTVAAICGQLAGAHYGESAIPHAWRAQLTMAEDIRYLADAMALQPEVPNDATAVRAELKPDNQVLE